MAFGRCRKNLFFVSIIIIEFMMILHPSAESASVKKLPHTKVCKGMLHCALSEIAATPESRTQGLMFRDRLPENQAMLFIYPELDFLEVWMKNMRMSLDIIWLDKSRRVIAIRAGAQPCVREPCSVYVPRKKARYVLEVVSGVAKKWNLKIGDQLTFAIPEEVMKTVK